MEQKLSAWNYMKNNKRRVSVLIVSLSLCFMACYITQFMLGTAEVSFGKVFLDDYSKMQYIQIAASSFGIDVERTPPEEIDRIYDEKNEELMQNLRREKGVERVYDVPVIYSEVAAVVGGISVEVPLVDKTEDVEIIMEHMGAVLIEGRLPEKLGEVVIDEASAKNNNYQVGGYFSGDSYDKDFTVAGIVSGSSYFGVGLAREGYAPAFICVLSDGSIEDMSQILEKYGITVRDAYDTVFDRKVGEKWLKEQVVDVISNSTALIFIGILVLLSLALFIVYSMYLRDRHDEWCLYCSIGYSRKTIYFSIIRELLISFTSAIAIGGVLIIVVGKMLEALIIKPQGLFCSFWYPEVFLQILCAYTFLFGLLQIPVRFALYRIRTVDAIDDDMY
ncbi:MAG: ABC transporter permease [Clostridium sp.]|nr:ABC transporter permease [Clostridium sp.]